MTLRIAAVCAVAVFAAGAQVPFNNNCSSPLGVFAGVNPSPPIGSDGFRFTNAGATDSNFAIFNNACAPAVHKDVWFTYTATMTGYHGFTTCTPPGFVSAGSLIDTVLAVYSASQCPTGPFATLQTPLECSDDSPICSSLSARSAVGMPCFQGETYLIRVGTPSATATGTFYVTVQTPSPQIGDGCSLTNTLSDGHNGSLTFDGTTTNATGHGCPEWSAATYSDVWFRYVASSPAGPAEVSIAAAGALDVFSVYTGTCPFIGGPPNMTPVVCGATTSASFPAPQGTTTFWIRCGLLQEPSPPMFFNLTIDAHPSPPNEDCAGAYLIYDGTYPYTASAIPHFTTVGALSNPAPPPLCVLTNSDVWFEYVATSTGVVQITTNTPAGEAPGTMTDTVVAVFSTCGGAYLACDDDGGANRLSTLSFYAVKGVHYRVMVAEFGATAEEGTFWLQIHPQFNLAMSSPSGPGSFKLNLSNGGHNHGVFTCLTLNQGLFPYGPFFGIEPSATELALQLTSNTPPFIAALDASGLYQFGPVTGLPTVTLYGVVLEFDALGFVAGTTSPTTWTVP